MNIMPTIKRNKDAGLDNDFYATHPDSVRLFLEQLKKDGIDLPSDIYEPAAGQGHIS